LSIPPKLETGRGFFKASKEEQTKLKITKLLKKRSKHLRREVTIASEKKKMINCWQKLKKRVRIWSQF